MGYNILRNFERARRKEKEQEFALDRIWAEQAPQRAEAKAARREALDKWVSREKPGPEGADYFWDKGPDKLSTVVPFGHKGDPVGAERQRIIQAAKAGVIPRESAAVEKTRAEAEEISYGTEFKRDLEDVLKGIMKAEGRQAKTSADEAALGLREAERGVSLREEAEIEAEEARIKAKIKAEAEAAKPSVSPSTRKMEPSLKRMLWEGTSVGGGFTAPGLGAPLYGYKNIADWLIHGAKKGYEYAFPEVK